MKRTYFLCLFILILFTVEVQAQSSVFGGVHPLVEINDVALKENRLFVLTGMEPFIHIFTDDEYSSWGTEGKGPGELRRPLAIEIANNSVFILDAPPRACKIVRYSLQGKYLSSEAVRDVQMCYDLKISNDYKIMEIGKWMKRSKELILFDGSPDTLTSYKEPVPVRIEPEEGPVSIYNIVTPFVAQPEWTTNNKGQIIFWDGNSDKIAVVDIENDKEQHVKIHPHSIKVQTADIEAWFSKQLSPDQSKLGIEDPFRNVRKLVREKMTFPDYYPLLSDIKTDPRGGIWILRASKPTGQIWSFLDSDGNKKTIKFPRNREVLTFGKEFIVTTKKDEKGVEYIELYNKDHFIN